MANPARRRRRRDRPMAVLLELFDRAFDRRAWHGPTLAGSLRGLSYREALWRPGPGRHNVWEIVLHAGYWKCQVRRRLGRDTAVRFPRPGHNWPRLPEHPGAAAWRRDVALLKHE